MLTWSTARNDGLERQQRPRPTQETSKLEVILMIYSVAIYIFIYKIIETSIIGTSIISTLDYPGASPCSWRICIR